MTINEIYFNNEISMRAFNTCIENKIETTTELGEIYSANGTFKALRNCGDKTNVELISMCLKYPNHKELADVKDLNTNKFTIQDIIVLLDQDQKKLINEFIDENFYKLSSRSKNGLARHLKGQRNLYGFSENIFSNQFVKIGQIKNIGNTSIPEIKTFINNLTDYIIKIFDLNKEEHICVERPLTEKKKLENVISNLNQLQINILNNYILTITEDLPERSKNAINILLNNELTVNIFFDKIFSDSRFNVANIKNIGKGSTADLKKYLNDINVFLNIIANTLDETELKKFEIRIQLKKIFNNNSIPEEIVDNSSVFRLLDYLINENIIFNKEEKYIFKNTFYAYRNNEHRTTEHISEVLGVTRERVRQRKIKLLEDISSKFNFLKCFDKNLLSKYNIASDQGSIVISDEKEEHINNIDNTNFSKQSITLILSFLLEEKFKLIGNKKDALLFRQSNIKDSHYWKNIYLIDNNLHQVFYFENLIEELAKKIKEQNNKTYKLNFKSYLSQFFKKNDIVFLDEIFPICEMLIDEELGICLDYEKNIVYKRNTYITLHDYAHDALEILGKPSHIDDINKQIKISNPDFSNIIKGSNLRRIFGFIPFGKTNVFGLKKWETEKRNIKGGTIRNIAEEFLQNYSNPVKLKVVVNFVLKYRPDSNLLSITHNLQMEENNKFIFFKGSLIGLKSKNYQIDLFSALESTSQTIPRSWEENYQELLNFILANNKLPSTTTYSSIEEKRISVWFYVQTSKINNNLLNESKTKLILDIRNNNKTREQKLVQFKSAHYLKLFEFVERNKRLPSAGKKEERTLYNFFYKQRKRFKESNLDNEEELKFIQIVKLLQQYKSDTP